MRTDYRPTPEHLAAMVAGRDVQREQARQAKYGPSVEALVVSGRVTRGALMAFAAAWEEKGYQRGYESAWRKQRQRQARQEGAAA